MRQKNLAGIGGLLLMLAMATAAMAGDPYDGTWKVNLGKSTYKPGPPPRSVTRTVEIKGNQMKAVDRGTDAEGKPILTEVNLILDGKEHPLTGNPSIDTYAATRIDAYIISYVYKKGGREVGNRRSVVSQDGKTLTTTLSGKNSQGNDYSNIVVAEKQ